jgi:DNA-binding transcriptional regulator/RsmH inhibitor MraZ
MDKFESAASRESEKYFRQELTIDDKGRVVLPAIFRKQFGEVEPELMITLNIVDEKPGYVLWTKDDYRAFIEKLFARTNMKNAEHRKAQQYFAGNSFEAIPDEQGRAHLPTVYGPHGELEFVWKPGENYAIIAPQDVEKTGGELTPEWFKKYCLPKLPEDHLTLDHVVSDIEDDGEISI